MHHHSTFRKVDLAATVLTLITFASITNADTFISGFEGDLGSTLGASWTLVDTDTSDPGDQLWTTQFNSTLGVTEGSQAIQINHASDVWQAGLRLDSAALIPLVAGSDTLEFDITPSGDATWRGVWIIMQGDGLDWGNPTGGAQSVQIDAQPGQTVHAVFDLNDPDNNPATPGWKQSAAASGGEWWQIWFAIMGGDAASPETFTIIDNIKFGGGAPSSPADFDNDGDVDGEDLNEWKTGFGVDESGDADGDLDTDGVDFLIWQRSLQGPVAGVNAVPEPAAAAIVLIGISVLAMDRSRRR